MNFLKYNIKRGVSNMGDPVKRAARMKIFSFPVILIWRRGLRNLDLELIYKYDNKQRIKCFRVLRLL